jgi:hypothetical protein
MESQPASPTPLAPLTKQKRSPIRIIILGTILLVLITYLSLGLYYRNLLANPPTQVTKPQKTTTIQDGNIANWQTYVDPTYHYSVKYPQTVTRERDSFYFIGDNKRTDTADGLGPHVAIYYRGENTTPKAIAQKELPDRPFTDTTINNATGVKVADSELDYYLMEKDGKGAIIRFTFQSQDYASTVEKQKIEQMRTIANQMLSTFQFIQN